MEEKKRNKRYNVVLVNCGGTKRKKDAFSYGGNVSKLGITILDFHFDEQKVYLDNIEIARSSIDPYNDADLTLLIEKMGTKEFKERNKIIDKQINNTTDEEFKLLKISEKFKNKKKTMPKGRN